MWVGAGMGDEKNDFPGIQSLMSEEEYHAAGLNKLNDQEVNALNQWLIRYTAQDAKVLITNNETLKKEAKREFETRIVGSFNGWDGNTQFVLENGEVWEQRQSGKWRAKLENPGVKIYTNFFGNYNMKILETGRVVGVRRIK